MKDLHDTAWLFMVLITLLWARSMAECFGILGVLCLELAVSKLWLENKHNENDKGIS